MAEISKYQGHSVGRLFLHNNRKQGDGVTHSNTDIDDERTHLNYNLKIGNAEIVRKRLNEVYHANRKDLIVLGEIIVTLPQDVKEEDQEKFFKACFDFYCNDFGEENIINAAVHLDEATPHIHIDFMPIKPMEKELSDRMKILVSEYEKDHGTHVTEILCAKDVLTREYYQNMHPRLYNYMADVLGYECEILNGATAGGNKTVLEMKMERYQKEVEQKGAEVDLLENNINSMMQRLDELGIDPRFFDMHEVLALMEKLQTENEMYRDLVTEYDLPIPQEAMKKVMQLAESVKSNFTAHTGSYIPKTDMFVIETFKNERRELPQQKIIDSNAILKDLVENKCPKEMTVKEIGGKKVILFPTDNIEDTFHNLMLLKNAEKSLKHLAFPRISNDTMHLAETVLKECSFQTEYYLLEKKLEEDRIREMEKDE